MTRFTPADHRRLPVGLVMAWLAGVESLKEALRHQHYATRRGYRAWVQA